MSRRLAIGLALCAPLVGVPLASAQTTVDGSAEVSVARSSTESTGQSHANGSVGQNYALGWSSTLFDPRIARYNLQGLFRTSQLSAGGFGQQAERGHADDLGYRFGATLLPASSMPFTFQSSRTRSASAGNLVPGNPIRSGLLAATGAPAADFESLNRELSAGWHIGLERLPQIDLSMRRGRSVITGGSYEARQSDNDLSASVLKNTRSTRQVFRYQATQSENVLDQTFEQRLGLLDYDLGVSPTAHTRMTVHAGRRTSFAQSVFVRPVDADAGAYVPASTSGASAARYGQLGYSYEPNGRFSLRVLGSADHQTGDQASTAAALATVSSHAEVVKGLVLTASGVGGRRQQVVGSDLVDVSTRSADAGVTYQVNGRWLGAGGSATRGVGTNITPDGLTGQSESWSGDAHVSTTVRWFGAGLGYDRSRYRDDLLDFGNYASERVRASAQAQAARGSLTANAEQLRIARGRAATFIRNLQRTVSGTASLRLLGQTFVSATAGHFLNDYEGAAGDGTDRSLFWSVGLDSAVRQALHVSGWLRTEAASASRTRFDQDALSAFARLEYRLRTLNFAAEYRRSHSRMVYPGMTGPDAFAGRQVRFSVTRQFGFRVR
ncbi:MAG: hypothetical protein ABL982_14695 [Vicinamibacterales bacterium]